MQDSQQFELRNRIDSIESFVDRFNDRFNDRLAQRQQVQLDGWVLGAAQVFARDVIDQHVYEASVGLRLDQLHHFLKSSLLVEMLLVLPSGFLGANVVSPE